MNAFGKFVVSVSEVLEFNQATLSGCVDIIVVEQPDGSLKSTPFHARFGKLKVLKSKDKIVKIHVNGLEANFSMKLGNAGEAFFEEENITHDERACQITFDKPLVLPDEPAQTNVVKVCTGDKEPKLLKDILQLRNNTSNRSTSAQSKGLSSQSADNSGRESESYINSTGHQSTLNGSKKGNKLHSEQSKKIKIKTLRPSSAHLRSLNLRLGDNTITYTVYSGLQGTQTITGHIFLWPKDANIIVSDVDGTITRTDFWGHVMPMFGKDWSQPGIAPLYTNIRRNGYYILYLTSRPIGQAERTKSFLHSIYQDGKMLPQGPLVMSPDRMMPSVKREIVYKRPELFKIAALKDIRSLFPMNHNPFHAGFGNRETDAISYKAVGIPLEKVFIVDPQGDIQHHNSTVAKSYSVINSMIKEIFPGIVKEKYKLAEELNPSNILRLDTNDAIEVNTAKVVS